MDSSLIAKGQGADSRSGPNSSIVYAAWTLTRKLL